jgi:hypothetical protein
MHTSRRVLPSNEVVDRVAPATVRQLPSPSMTCSTAKVAAELPQRTVAYGFWALERSKLAQSPAWAPLIGPGSVYRVSSTAPTATSTPTGTRISPQRHRRFGFGGWARFGVVATRIGIDGEWTR